MATNTNANTETILQSNIELNATAEAVPVAEAGEITQDQLSLKKRFLNWRTLLPLAIVVIALAIFAQRMNIEPQKIGAALQKANLLLFVLAFVIYYVSFGLRAWRWRILLENVGYTKEAGIHLPGFWKRVEIIYISFFANVVVPAKLGDLYRAYLLKKEISVSTTRSFGTVLAERLLDLIVLLVLFIPAVLISLREHMPAQLQLSLELLLGAVIAGIIGLIVLRVAREPIAKLVPARFREQYYHFQEGTLGSFKRLPTLAILTAGVWVCESLRFFFVALSLQLITGSLLHITAAAIVIGLAEALLTALPTTGGGIGVVEAGMVGIISLYSSGTDIVNQAAAAILLDRSISLFSVLIIGLIVFLIAFGRKAAQQKA
uniref:TIGR00374 family protein n=1 Tax=Thermosporothrix sp. COM3 TaxID=2490863 RepID=A0A455SJD0_9CHLR|nr:TIGR00374 family protein [Thermosporothrix sp. COM3]